ncbi:protein PFC0760c-like [Aedes aegypti]|uniref:Uncharacterized protein n=1 Tax=Aedes aegypti TaxID=7159 RepID=A0A6I8TMI0_AEDAE|nr:protein PFC0760c-like [Aedes aegypti]
MNAQVLKITSSALYDPYYGYDSSNGAKDDEVGYVKSNSEKGEGGFHHVETFQKKGGDEYEHEHERGYGESKHDPETDYEDQPEPNIEKRDNNRDLKTHKRNYEVVEEHGNDHKNPNQHKTYGAKPTKPTKPSKRPSIPEFGTRLTLPKRTTLKQNHNGYETVIYHGHENESSEKGYGRRNHHNAPSKTENFDEKDDESDDGEQDEAEAEQESQDREDDTDNADQSNFGDNYNSFKYDDEFGDFSKNFDDDGGHDRSEEHSNRNDDRVSSNRNHFDYDEEVDREQVDETANEDRYQGGEYDDEDEDKYRGHNRRNYDYSSEKDYYA